MKIEKGSDAARTLEVLAYAIVALLVALALSGCVHFHHHHRRCCCAAELP